MGTPTRALIVCTLASLAAVIAATIAAGASVWLWAAWAGLAVVTVAVTAADMQRR